MFDMEKIVDALEYLISSDCTDTQFDYINEIETAIELLKKQKAIKPKKTNREKMNGQCVVIVDSILFISGSFVRTVESQ